MTTFGDDDPEDAWDDHDPPTVKLALLERIVASITAEAVARGRSLRARARIRGALASTVLMRQRSTGLTQLQVDALHLIYLRLLELDAWSNG